MIKGGPKTINDGLVLCLDAHDAKSYAGEPTTNFFYRETPRIDSSYSTYVHNSDSTWASNHPDAIRVYNTDGTEISSYVNTGANSGNWQVIAHAHWVYDNDLRKPVVKMHRVSGYEGQWRAISRNLGHNLSGLGLTAGDKFTISWLQKAYAVGVYARAGIYMRNTGGSNGFHAGQASSSDVGQLSSELGKWAHKSKTFTVPSSMNETGYNVSLYMYGHYSPTNNNTIYISDVQVETGDYATPIVQGASSSNSGYWGTRSATNGWVDRTTNSNDGTLTNMIGTGASHYRNGQVIMPVDKSYLDFDGSNDYINLPHSELWQNISQISYDLWFNPDVVNVRQGLISSHAGASGANNDAIEIEIQSDGTSFVGFRSTNGTFYAAHYNSALSTGVWYNLTGVLDPAGKVLYYLNGAQVGQNSSFPAGGSVANSASQTLMLARYSTHYFNGKIGLFRAYNKTLTAAEVLSNYNATKGRFS